MIKKSKYIIIFIVIFILVIAFFLSGRYYGKKIGVVVGNITGSIEGFNTGIENGYEAGKEEGLHADDTVIEINTVVSRLGRLDILVADFDIVDDVIVDNTYQGVYSFRGSAVFSVDMDKAEIQTDQNNNEVLIRIPEPELKLNIYDTQTLMEKKASVFADGSVIDGMNAYFETLSKIKNISLEEVANYQHLSSLARSKAREQVIRLVTNLSISSQNIIVQFIGE